MKQGMIVLASLAISAFGMSTLASAQETEEGLCTWSTPFTGSCIFGDPIAACEATVEDECHNSHWKVTQANCSSGAGTVTCFAKWVD